MQVETWGSVGAAIAAVSAAVVSPFLVNLKSKRDTAFRRKQLEDEFASKQTNATWEQAEWLVSQLRVDADSLRKRVEKSEEDATNAQRRAETCERQAFQAQSMILELQGQVKSLNEQVRVLQSRSSRSPNTRGRLTDTLDSSNGNSANIDG